MSLVTHFLVSLSHLFLVKNVAVDFLSELNVAVINTILRQYELLVSYALKYRERIDIHFHIMYFMIILIHIRSLMPSTENIYISNIHTCLTLLDDADQT